MTISKQANEKVGTHTRTIVHDRTAERGQRNKVVEKGAKTEAGKRTLPLPKPVLRALKAYRATQAADRTSGSRGGPTRTPTRSR
ncbi:hypothetical protein ACIQNG_08280 [Streptomyces sp. NPDC091377]|uniref:hypothetical protein n=1 Tax=Streptomyces sp. NPDC091377 TaxID=3365995 RepID=UPI0037F34951